MRQSLAKGVRRDLRRAIGTDALNQVDVLDRAVTILQSSVVGLQRELSSLAVNHAEHRRDSAAELGLIALKLEGFIKAVDRSSQRSFLQRFRWLFLGR